MRQILIEETKKYIKLDHQKRRRNTIWSVGKTEMQTHHSKLHQPRARQSAEDIKKDWNKIDCELVMNLYSIE